MRVVTCIGLLAILLLTQTPRLSAETLSFEVFPESLELHFEMVELGQCKEDIVTFTNTGTETVIVTPSLGATSDIDYTLLEAGSEVLGPGDSADFSIEFCPQATGLRLGTLEIDVLASVPQTVTVDLLGDGGAATTPADLIDLILEFFDDSVCEGTLEGRGEGYRAARRLRAMRNRIRTIDFLLRYGYDNAAIRVTRSAIRRSDGEPRPRDFVEGEATEELNIQLEMLLTLLGG